MFLKLDKNACVDKKAVYVFKFYLDWNNIDVVYKIGVTGRDEVSHRLGEVLVSFYERFRYVPRCSAVRFSSCEDAYGKESLLHSLFAEYKVDFNGKFSGSKEFFSLDEDLLLVKYDIIVKGM